MGEISIGVNPGALKLRGNGRSSGQSPEQPGVLLQVPRFGRGC